MSDLPSNSLLICTYGPSGIGKTVDMGYSFPNAIFLAAPGATTPIATVCGYTPKVLAASTIEHAIQVITELGELRRTKADAPDTVVIDDFSFMSEQTLLGLERQGARGWDLFGQLKNIGLLFRDHARLSNLRIVFNCWEQAPKTKQSGEYVRGGPQLAGKLIEAIPAMSDCVYRAKHEPEREPWPAAYHCTSTPGWVQKCRLNIGYQISPGPLNLAEYLRASGIPVSRHPEIKEDVVEALSEKLTGQLTEEDRKIIDESYRRLIEAKMRPEFAKWHLRDAIDRSTIRNAVRESQTSFFGPSRGSALSGLTKLG